MKLNIRFSYHIKNHAKKKLKAFSILILPFFLSGCINHHKSKSESSLDFSSMKFSDEKKLSYAKQFSISKADGFSLLKIQGENPILLVEKNHCVPSGIPSDFTVLKKPIKNSYLVSSSAFDFFIRIDALDCIKFSGIKKESMYLPEVFAAMEEGKIIHAGKYSAPDYEMLYGGGADLSIQNTMIYHKPEVREKLEQLNIPVIVEKSSYEKNPLGRLEWIKFYGLLYDKENEAELFFNSKIKECTAMKDIETTGKTVAFFYFTSSRTINVRKPGDYIARSIEMAGGKYFLQKENLEEDNALSSMNMQTEDFYVHAKNSDILIYNSTVDGMILDKKTLLKKNPLLIDFSGFKKDRIYCTDKKFFQETTGVVDFMIDLNKILNDKEDDLHYLLKLK